jgi:predicted ATPase/class 3 adenylate cyclase
MTSPRPNLPTGTVTFLFTDIEGSTRLLHDLGPEAYARALADHRRLLRDAFAQNGGVEVDTQGDAFFVAFPTAPGALAAAREAQAALDPGPIRVRMGIHTGTPIVAEEGYVGTDVHRAARIAAVGHGGQVLVSAATATLASDAVLRDLGMHRLKDLSAPERIYQFGNDDFPSLRTLYRTNFPIPVTPFLGRERELAEVVDLIGRQEIRLVTLTGPGGTGKTRLGSQAAGELADRYPGGVWWVPLAPLRDPRLVLESASRAVGASDGLAEHIGDLSMLILFDNFEQVVDAASDVAGLLGACPNLDVVVTSREPLHVAGEHEYQVPPMAPTDGVELFMTRAHAIDPTVQASAAIDAICARLDELPLAIELAAARIKLLAPEKMLERLDRRLPLLTGGARDLPERQRTLRATIEWSYELLTPDEQLLFARLSIFRGGATLEAVEAIGEADLDTLQSLVDKSLVRRRADRFVMLETIREFAAEALDRSGEADLARERHARFYGDLVREAAPHLQMDEADWVDRLEGEHDNLRAVLDRLSGSGDSQATLDLAGRVFRFWYLKSHLKEGQRRLEEALRADEEPTAARALALDGAAVMALNLGDHVLARERAEGALAAFRQIGDRWGEAYSNMMVGNAIGDGGGVAEAVPYIEESIRQFDEIGDEHFALIARFNLSWMVGELGDPARERALNEEIIQRVDDAAKSGRWSARGPAERTVAMARASLAMLERDDGRLDAATDLMRDSIETLHELGATMDVAINFGRLASVLALRGDGVLAARLMAKSDAMLEELGVTRSWWDIERNDKTRALLAGLLEPAALTAASESGRTMTTDEAIALAAGPG